MKLIYKEDEKETASLVLQFNTEEMELYDYLETEAKAQCALATLDVVDFILNRLKLNGNTVSLHLGNRKFDCIFITYKNLFMYLPVYKGADLNEEYIFHHVCSS